MIDDLTDQVVVMRSHLEELEEILGWVNGHLQALDLSENYRACRPEKSYSILTRRVDSQHERIKGYLNNV